MRLIDADALIERIKYSFYDNERVRIDMVTGTFLTEYCSPTVDAEPVRHGRWIDRGDYVTTAYGSLDIKVCSNCNAEVTIDQYDDYCPHCGAVMDLEEE